MWKIKKLLFSLQTNRLSDIVATTLSFPGYQGDQVKFESRGKIGLLKYLNLSRSSLRSVAPGLKAIIARGA